MLKRIVTALVGIVILLPFIIFSDTWAIVVMTGVLSVVGVCEMLKCTGNFKKIPVTVLSSLVAIASPVLTRVLSGDSYTTVLLMIYMAYAVAMMTTAVFSKGKYRLSEATQNIVMTVYISFGFSAVVLLRDMPSGIILMLLSFLIPWVCDASAYFVGVFFGKHKLIPNVSPKKTVEGAIGGVVGVVLITVIFGAVVQLGFQKETNYFLLIMLAFVGGIVGACGDLIASLLKREYEIKDYGNIFPGHGGVLDRFDSTIAVSTFMFVICRIFSDFTIFGV